MRKNDAPLRPKGRHRREITDREAISRQWGPLRQPRRAARRPGFRLDFRAFPLAAALRAGRTDLRALRRAPPALEVLLRPLGAALRAAFLDGFPGAFRAAVLRLGLDGRGAAVRVRLIEADTWSMGDMPSTVLRTPFLP